MLRNHAGPGRTYDEFRAHTRYGRAGLHSLERKPKQTIARVVLAGFQAVETGKSVQGKVASRHDAPIDSVLLDPPAMVGTDNHGGAGMFRRSIQDGNGRN